MEAACAINIAHVCADVDGGIAHGAVVIVVVGESTGAVCYDGTLIFSTNSGTGDKAVSYGTAIVVAHDTADVVLADDSATVEDDVLHGALKRSEEALVVVFAVDVDTADGVAAIAVECAKEIMRRVANGGEVVLCAIVGDVIGQLDVLVFEGV